MAATSKKEGWNTHEGACTSCRARKIRCGREKPQCGSCVRDHVECEYGSAPKRVNHIKILCQNFDDIQERLIWMQEELSTLTDVFKNPKVIERLGIGVEHDSSGAAGCESGGTAAAAATTSPETGEAGWAAAGYVVRDSKSLTEKYHGPGTLVARCRDFSSRLRVRNGHAGGHVERLVERMEAEAAGDVQQHVAPDEVASPATGEAVCLPPRQFLSIVLERFMKLGDWSTDMFTYDSLLEAAEHIYTAPNSPAVEPWSVCFNLITLLVLGAERPVRSDDLFLRPALQTAYVALQMPSFFMSPRLISMQALALLSIFSQQYYDESLGDAVFAQACILARAMGLHETTNGSVDPDLSPAKIQERQKVFRCLYMRDRCSAITRGSMTWLPRCAFEGRDQLAPVASCEGDAYQARQELAGLQDELLRLLFAPSELPGPKNVADRRLAWARLEQNLARWAEAYRIPSPTQPTTLESISLHLAFLSTRIRVLEGRYGGDAFRRVSERLLQDARLCCFLVATACASPPSEDLACRANKLLGARFAMSTSSSSRGETEPLQSSSSSSRSPSPVAMPTSLSDAVQPSHTPARPTRQWAPDHAPTPLPLHRLGADFPPAALFIITWHILGLDRPPSRQDETEGEQARWQDNEEDQGDVGDDIALLEALLACFDGVSATGGGKKGCVAKLGRVLQNLVDIVRAARSDRGSNGAYRFDQGQTQHLHATDSIVVAAPTPIQTFSDKLVPSSAVSGGMSNNVPRYYSSPPFRAANSHSNAGSSTAACTASSLSTSVASSAGTRATSTWTMFSQDHMSAEGTTRPETQPGSISKSTPSSLFPGALPDMLLDVSPFLSLSQPGGLSPVAGMWDDPHVTMADNPASSNGHLLLPDLASDVERQRRKRARQGPGRHPDDGHLAVD